MGLPLSGWEMGKVGEGDEEVQTPVIKRTRHGMKIQHREYSKKKNFVMSYTLTC